MNHKLILSLTSLLLANVASSATRVDLKHQSANYLKPYFTLNSNATINPYELRKVKTNIGINQTTHVRIQEMYAGIPVLGAASIIHIPKANKHHSLLASLNDKTTMSGVIYEGLEADLAATPKNVLSKAQQEKAMQEAKIAFETKTSAVGLKYTKETVKPIVYIDENKKAHYAFLLSFYYDDMKTGAHRPTSIVDAQSLQVYRDWDAVMTENSPEITNVLAGGIGGNEKIGPVIYDGATGHLPALQSTLFNLELSHGGVQITVDFCFLFNDDITIYDMSYANVVYATCDNTDNHNNIYWMSNDSNGTRWKDDEMNGGYSPSLDAFYNATVVNNFYHEWYGVPALVEEDGVSPMKLVMRVHYGRNFDNAFWDGEQMTFGDGGTYFYPLTSLGVTAHEISHGFTSQHSDLSPFEPEMQALHEAFSDEAAVAMQYYATGKNTWDIGRDITKNEGALRYLDNPKKDGHSIDNMKDFDATEAHEGAGVFNKAFYLIATSKGWDIRKAFNIMVGANMNYWTSNMTTLTEAACGVTSAARDYGYNTTDVRVAFIKVGIDTGDCD